MKRIKLLALCAIVAGFTTSCQKEELASEQEKEIALTPTKAELTKLFDMGVNIDDVTIEEIAHLDGTKQAYLVSGDIQIPRAGLEKLEELEALADGQKQYRTSNLVSGANRTIDILGYTGSGNALTSTMRTGLQWAVNNYNRIGTSLNFRLTFGTNYQAADMVVYNNNQSGGGGSAGFPSGGRAYKWIQINQGTSSFGNNVNEHVIGHEIGHCIGFRHQDWRSRQSCGQNSNEGQAGVGAILIPGTPTSDRADSIMLACFGSGEDGEFTSSDITALRALY
ncbi:peptidase [Aquimarina sp. TRL1]|uniref:M57 family metalloprotease n=1 Tax=Aquimarina sp. (strain TRL1) TaxID=2736252 RepID=UPI001589477A|nr:M57 family metalloprotease [Aquimarina sp. TRL1]QKX03690.1 peptidase [Aquimarina sp. TRL1]